MNTYFALFVIATLASLTITPLIRRLCERYKLLDVPMDNRRVHTHGIPRLGGIAIYASLLIALSMLPLVSNNLTESLRDYTKLILVIAVPATLVLLLGIYDDLRGTNARVKFIGLGLIATLFFAMGGRIEALAIPFVGVVEFPPVISFVITVFWLVAISNAFNLIDGIDGLAPGAALFASVVIFVVSLGQANPMMIVVTLVLCGALTGFLRYNFNPASIFLGDSGALFVGFLLASLSVVGAQKATTAVAVITPVLAFGLPVVDTGVTMARRLISGRPVFQGDGEHIHHMLLARGWSQRRVVLILYGVCAVFGLVAALSTTTSSPQTGFVLFVIAVAVTIAVGHLRYHEVDELRAGVKRTVGDRRARVANNIRVRRAGRALSNASNLNDLFEAIALMLEAEEFAYANVQLGQPGHAESNGRAYAACRQRRSSQPIQFRNGRILWSWKREGLHEEDVIGSSKYWCFRLPLSTEAGEWGWINLYRPFDVAPVLMEMNYLFGFLRTDLAAASSRILQSYEKPSSIGQVRLPVPAGKIAG
ncbi:MAG: undecaprenyl/decaprenyl-phosphate alpha-N-acetylglucosaminyl 1-phosphate transferase [Acidobacteriota bacterium]|nr:undecaprenyl/decaprenyl-phosphate alpha-N-acetylglucosaminyl 1-phosphate transferase [Acidobacteriota bacterium]